jgi:hypothetical protein
MLRRAPSKNKRKSIENLSGRKETTLLSAPAHG